VRPSLCAYLLWSKLSEMGDWTLRVSPKPWRSNESQPTGAFSAGLLRAIRANEARLSGSPTHLGILSHMQ
jgi:hypothetical protein